MDQGFFTNVMGTIWDLFARSSTSASTPIERTTEEEEIDMSKSWVYVQSPRLRRIDLIAAESLAAELNHLKKQKEMTNLYKRIFTMEAEILFNDLNDEEKYLVKNVKLESSDRSALVKEATHKNVELWLEHLKVMVFDISPSGVWEEWQKSFQETKYDKGTLGEMHGMAWQASHAGSTKGLTPRLLSEITWSLFKSLQFSIRIAFGRELTSQESEEIIKAVLPCESTILNLWILTSRISKSSRSKEGRLPTIWIKEDKKEEEEKKEKKKRADLPHFEVTREKPIPSSLSNNRRAILIDLLHGVYCSSPSSSSSSSSLPSENDQPL